MTSKFSKSSDDDKNFFGEQAEDAKSNSDFKNEDSIMSDSDSSTNKDSKKKSDKDTDENNHTENLNLILGEGDDEEDEDDEIEKEIKKQESLTLQKFSKVKVDCERKPRGIQSTKVLKHNSLKLDNDVVKIEEEVRFEIGEQSEYVLDPSEQFYVKKKILTTNLNNLKKDNNSCNLAKPGQMKYNTTKMVSSGKKDIFAFHDWNKEKEIDKELEKEAEKKIGLMTEKKNVKFSVKKIVFEYKEPEEELPDLPIKKKSSKKQKKKENDDEEEEDDSGLTEKEREKLREIREKRMKSKLAKQVESIEKKNTEIEIEQSQINSQKEANKKKFGGGRAPSKSNSKGKKNKKK